MIYIARYRRARAEKSVLVGKIRGQSTYTSRGVASGVTRKRVGSRAQFTSNKQASPRDLPRTGSEEASSLGLEYARPRPRWARLGSPFLRRLLIRASTHSPQVHLHRYTRRVLDRLDRERMQLDLCYTKNRRGFVNDGPSNVGIVN